MGWPERLGPRSSRTFPSPLSTPHKTFTPPETRLMGLEHRQESVTLDLKTTRLWGQEGEGQKTMSVNFCRSTRPQEFLSLFVEPLIGDPLAAYKHGASSMSCSVVTFPIPQEVVPEYSCALFRPNCSPQIRKDGGTTSFYITHLGIQDTELGPSAQYSQSNWATKDVKSMWTVLL